MARNNQIKPILFAWLGLILLDVFVVRDFAWVLEHWDIKRALVNLGLTRNTQNELVAAQEKSDFSFNFNCFSQRKAVKVYIFISEGNSIL
jgi:hypothetical protein